MCSMSFIIIGIQYTPTSSISKVNYGADSVTVTVEWIQAELPHIMYYTAVSPSVPVVLIGNTSRQLTILYNIKYNFSVEATTPCRPNATAFITLNYGEVPAYTISWHCIYMISHIIQIPTTLAWLYYVAKCERPELIPVCTTSCNSVPTIMGIDDNDIRVEGNTITFSCPPGLELVGPNSATCTGNGEWGPDLSGLMCNNSASAPMCNDSNSKFFQWLNFIIIATIRSWHCWRLS